MPILARKSRLKCALSENPAQKPIAVIGASLCSRRRHASWIRTNRTRCEKLSPALRSLRWRDRFDMPASRASSPTSHWRATSNDNNRITVSIEVLIAELHGSGNAMSGGTDSDSVLSARERNLFHSIVQAAVTSALASPGREKQPFSRMQVVMPLTRSISQRRSRQPISSRRAMIKPQIRRFSGVVGVRPSTVYL